MRVTETSDDLKVLAVAGSYVVTLGFNLPEEKCDGLLGFSIHRTDHETGEARYIEGMKCFEETDPGFPPGARYPSDKQPIQSFQWGDYSAYPGRSYTYRVAALKGTPKNLEIFAETAVDITAEGPESAKHVVLFNRGVAASQEYARRFGNRKPDKVPDNKAFEWLSRGLYEALEEFVSSCEPGKHALRIAAYEFHYKPLLKLIKETADRGVDIQIVYDARKDNGPKKANRKAVQECQIKDLCTERREGASYISHNKFIVKLEDGEPKSVWTGGTNFSQGGIFGHSNVAHIVNDEETAEKYLNYWQLLQQDLPTTDMKQEVEDLSPIFDLPVPEGVTAMFSPRSNLELLDLYAEIAQEAKNGLFMTFAFGMNDQFKEVYRTSQAPLRYALLEQKTRPMDKESEEYENEVKEIQELRKMPENFFSVGDFVRTNELDGWLEESLSNLNKNVRYVHNKFMLVDPLSDDPIVIAGSANFSAASTDKNDENMVVVRGDKRVADIYLGEFMRLAKHHAFRESLGWQGENAAPKPLRTDEWWKDSFGNTAYSARRRFFAQVTI